MPVESWLNTEDVPDFAAHATAMIDAALTGSGLTREAYWAAVRKGYREQDTGYGSAISLIFFVAVLLISLIQRRLTREKD